MMKLFNSTFEVSLRVMLILSQTANANMTLDRIVAYDFIAIYGRYFGLAESNLHGDNDFGFSELSARRGVMQTAIKDLVLDGLVKAIRRSNGFCYEITTIGRDFCKAQTTDYAEAYRHLVCSVHNKYANMTEVEIMSVISQNATNALRR